jgi:hypothetical protein
VRKLASFIMASLDGFYEGPNGEFDFFVTDASRRVLRGAA